MSDTPKPVDLKFQQIFISSKGKGKSDICFFKNTLICLSKGQLKQCIPFKKDENFDVRALQSEHFITKAAIKLGDLGSNKIAYLDHTG